MASRYINRSTTKEYANEEHDAYAFRTQGNVHHLISPELTSDINSIV